MDASTSEEQKRRAELVAELAKDSSSIVRAAIARRTEDKKLLMWYADDDDDLVASDALHRIDDQHFLFEVATNESRTLRERRAAAEGLLNPHLLKAFVHKCQNNYVLEAGVSNIKDEVFLAELAKSKNEKVSKKANAMLERLSPDYAKRRYVEKAYTSLDFINERTDIASLDDQKALFKLAQSKEETYIRWSAFLLLHDDDLLVELLPSFEGHVLDDLLSRISSQNCIVKLVKDTSQPARARAMYHLGNQEILASFSGDKDPNVRRAVASRTTDHALLVSMATDVDENVRIKVAERCLDKEILGRLAVDESQEVRSEVQRTEYLDSDTWILLTSDSDPYIAGGAARMVHDQELLAKLVERFIDNSYNRKFAFRNLYDFEILARLAVNKNASVRASAAQALMKERPEPSDTDEVAEKFLRAVRYGWIHEVESMLHERPDLALHDEAPLLYAQMQEHHAIVKLLLEHGADVNVLLYGWTALSHAVEDAVDSAHQKQLPLMEYADWSMVELLLSFGADHSIVCDGLTVFDRLRKWKLLENSPLSNYKEHL